MKSPDCDGTLMKIKSKNLTGYMDRESQAEDHIVVKDDYLIKDMDTKRQSPFEKTENKSKVDKHDIICGDGKVSEPKFCSTLKDMIEDVSTKLPILC